LEDLRTGLALLPGSNNILAPGFRMDVVTEVVPADWPGMPKELEANKAKQAITWENACCLLAQRVYGCEVPEEHRRTLIANKFHTQWPCTSDMKNEYLAFLKRLEDIANGNGLAPGTMDGDAYVRRNAYAEALDMAIRGRSYFSTAGGRTGIGPSDTRLGDLVCVLIGGPTPYILRLGASRSSYTLVGESYVNGLMSSEALNLRNLGPIPEDNFVIE
jgi:hypothetical protein